MDDHPFRNNDAQVARSVRKDKGNPRDMLICALRHGYVQTAAVCVDVHGVSLQHELDDGPYPIETPFSFALRGGPSSETERVLAWLLERNALCDSDDVVTALRDGFLEEARQMVKQTPTFVYTWNTESTSVCSFEFKPGDTVQTLRDKSGKFMIDASPHMKMETLVKKRGQIFPVNA